MSDMDVARVRAACEFADDADGKDSAALDRILAERDTLAQRLADAERERDEAVKALTREGYGEWKLQNSAAEARATRAEAALRAIAGDIDPYIGPEELVAFARAALTPTEEPEP